MDAVHTLGRLKTTPRPCACGCGTDLTELGKRSHAKYASGACRARADRMRKGGWTREPKKAHSTPARRARRPNPPRVRPTLTLDEARALADILALGEAPDEENFWRAIQKIADGLEREEARHG